MQKIHNHHAVYSIGYHIIWCFKYRHEIFDHNMSRSLRNVLAQACSEYGWKLEECNTDKDHVHIFVKADHTVAPVQIAQTLKSISAVSMFGQYPNLKGRKFWGSGMWSRSTFYATVGSVSESAIRKYIQEQSPSSEINSEVFNKE